MAAYNANASSVSLSLLTLLFLFSVSLIAAIPRQSSALPQTDASRQIEGTLHIVAVMAEFQPDDNPYTSGNGTFGSGSLPYLESPTVTIDPLPHNRSYFEAHLEFVKNYYEKMSKKKLQISYQVLPQVYRVPGTMADYSPTGRDPDLSPMAHFAADVWSEVHESGDDLLLPPSHENILYVIFHAGAGRDIELTGTTLKRTPQDLPSLYLDKDAFREFLNDPSFSGFPLTNEDHLVHHSLILPRTLSREGENLAGEPYVLQLSINGLATALTGTHLGLPPLFHTETGHSGIGRFGLMDGAAMFSYSGLFPPEMSAWEKIHAGWADPFTISQTETQKIELPAASLGREQSILKLPVTNDEYFLVENRHRDPDNSGVTFTIRRPDGSTVQQTFTNSDHSFTNQESGFEEMLEPGVITSVSNYDFSLPGGADLSADRELNGGILIWHVDDAVVREKLGFTGINNDEGHRAVTLKEADGAQDIGRPVTAGTFQNEINGSPFDFWWSGNNASVIVQGDTTTLYQNRFGPDTLPSNHSHTGAPSYFELSDFSDNLSVASFLYTPENPHSDLYTPVQVDTGEITAEDHFFIPPESGHHKNYPLAIIPFQTGASEGAFIPSRTGLFYLNTKEITFKKIAGFQDPIRQPLFLESQNQIAIVTRPENPSGNLRVSLYDFTSDTLLQKWSRETESFHGLLSQSTPGVLDADHSAARFDTESGTIHQIGTPTQSSEKIGEYQSVLRQDALDLQYPGGQTTHPVSGILTGPRYHTGIIQEPESISFYLLEENRLRYFSELNSYAGELIHAGPSMISRPAIADLQHNGYPEFVFIEEENNRLIAKNSSGGMLANFPVYPPEGSHFTGTPLIGDTNGDGFQEIIVMVRSSYSLTYYAYNLSGDVAEGFPLAGGSIHPDSALPVQPALSGNHLIGISPAGELKVWEFTKSTEPAWQSAYGNKNNNKLSSVLPGVKQPDQPEQLLDRSETYNWPNPASGHTFIRFRTNETAEITLKIVTLSGHLIYENKFRSMKGLAQDIEIDTGQWASGGYICLITAEAGTTKEQKKINIAIIQ